MKNYVAITVTVIIAVFLLLTTLSVVQINPGEVGVITQLGKVAENTLQPGIHIITPVVTRVNRIETRIQRSDTPAEAKTHDLQDINTTVALNWHIDGRTASGLYQTIGSEPEVLRRIIEPAVEEVIKAESAKNSAEEIITNREGLKQAIDESLTDRLAHYGIQVDDISLVGTTFQPEFNNAVEQKQIAQQQAQKAVFLAQQAEQEAAAQVNLAKGQAESQRLIQATITPEILQQSAIKKWDGHFPNYLAGNGQLPLIQMVK
ncbi:prohibitin family protein [Leptolyngbya sp. AN03gr2]|uniref:prohibitin family protein n=1 Tax=unclassified Leptolyngbya TaxID=2650499 RepID=UPI003D31F461